MDVRPVTMEQIQRVFAPNRSVLSICLFGGDRAACCPDGGVGVFADGELVAAASIARHGEGMSGRPAIVGIMTLPGHRRRGYGRAALLGVIAQAAKLGLSLPLRFDCVTVEGAALCRALTDGQRALLDIHAIGCISAAALGDPA